MADALDKKFLGTGWAFPPEFDPSGRRVKLVSHEEDILESLRILMATSPGERVMQPTYGCGLKPRVFDSINDSTITLISDIIRRAVLFFEPRIILDGVRVDTGRQYEGVLDIVLDYTIRRTNTRHNMVYPFYYKEGTDIRS
jgi:phage baseplate assembly protein W